MSQKSLDDILPIELYRRFPKAELHRHLDGSVRPETIIELAREQGVELPTFDVAELRELICVKEDCPSLVEYLRGFDIALSVMQQKYAITRIMYEVCEDAAKDGVKYIEIRFSPILHTKMGLQLSSIMEAVIEGKVSAELKLNIVPRIIVSGMRQLPSSITKQLAEIAWRFRDSGVVGFDLAGPEDGFSSKNHKEAFAIVHQNLLNCTLHSGEAASWESVSDSIQHCGAQRIGHGVRLIENHNLTQYVANRRIAIEVCLTSNLQTKAITSYEAHPIRTYTDMGVICIPCTDNSVVSNVTLSEEYHKIQSVFKFTISEMVLMIDNGFRHGFLESRMRNRLRKESLRSILKILGEEGYPVDNIITPETQLHFGSVLLPGTSHLVRDQVKTDMYTDGSMRRLLYRLPKADLDCRFLGSVSVPTLWKLFQSSDPTFLTQMYDFLGIEKPTQYSEFENLIYKHEGLSNIRTALDIMSWVLQTPEQIKQGLNDIFREASKDNFKYIELFIRPSAHTKQGLSHSDVLKIVLEESDRLAGIYNLKHGIGLCVDNTDDGIVEMTNVVFLAVQNRDKICGFGFYGFDREHSTGTQRNIKKLYNLLKKNQVNVCISAGKTDVQPVVTALHVGGACRLNGCFAVERDPSMLSYLANHAVPIELSLTNLYSKCFDDISDTGDALRLFFDRGLKIAPCSLDLSLYPQSRNEMMYKMALKANFTVREIVEFIMFSYTAASLNYADKRTLFRAALEETKQILQESNVNIDLL